MYKKMEIRQHSMAVTSAMSVSNEQEHKMLIKVLTGDTTSPFPRPILKSVRLFLASNHSDFEEERQVFWSDIYPEIQSYCLHLGAELLVFDPYQGCDTDVCESPQNVELMIEEIHRCQQYSTGVSFLAFIGDKYGSCSLPITIKSEELSHIRNSAFDCGQGEIYLDIKPLDEWYKLDENAAPPVYVLQAKSKKGKTFDKNESKALQKVIQRGAKLAHRDGLINQVNQRYHERYFNSPLEKLVQSAMSSEETTRRSLVVQRKMDLIRQSSVAFPGSVAINEDQKCSSEIFFDGILGKDADFNPQERLSKLSLWLEGKLDKPNLEAFRLSIAQSEDGRIKWNQSKEKQKYFDQFYPHLTYKLIQLIDAGFCDNGELSRNPQFKDDNKAWLYREAYYHLHYAYERGINANILGQQKLMAQIEEHLKVTIKGRSNTLILRGDEGCGKTAVLCEIVRLIPSWFPTQKPIVIPRFVGATPNSEMANEFLRDLCAQISLVYNDNSICQHYSRYFSLEKMSEWFNTCLEKPAGGDQPLIILIDDIHLLKVGHFTGERNLKWIPGNTGENVVVICTAQSSTDLQSVPIRQVEPQYIVDIGAPQESHFLDIIKTQLGRKQRTITKDQMAMLKNCLRQNPSVTFCHILAEFASQWDSAYTPNGHGLATNLVSFFEEILSKLNKKNGQEVMAYVCGYITFTQHGISEKELVDLISCCPEIMSKIYSETEGLLKPDIQRFPMMKWLQIRSDIDPYVEAVVVDERLLIRWRNAVFGSVVRRTYFATSSFIKRIHNDIAEYFSNSFADSDSADGGMTNVSYRRLVMPQPLHITTTRDTEWFNMRRIKELWYHLLHSANIDQLKTQALCNFDYLYCLVRSSGLMNMLSVFEAAMLQILHHDLHTMYSTMFRAALESICIDSKLLAAETIGRLRYTRARNSKFLNNLVEQAMTWVDNYGVSPLIVPLTSWLRPPKDPFALSFQLNNWKSSTTLVQPTLNYQHVLVCGAKDNGYIRMYHVASQTLVRTFLGHSERVECITLSHNGQFFVTGSSDQTIKMWDLIQGGVIRSFMPHMDKVLCILLSKSDELLFSGSADRTVKLSSVETGHVVRTFNNHSGPVTSICLNSFDEVLISGSADFTVKVWRVSNGEEINRIGGLMAPVNKICLSSNDAFLLVSCEDETIRVFSLVACRELHFLQFQEGKVCSIDIAEDDCQVFIGSSDGNLYSYDVHDGMIIDKQNCGNHPITSVKVTSDSCFLFSAGGDWIHVWGVNRRESRMLLISAFEDANLISCVSVSKDGKTAAAGSYLGYLQLWDLDMCTCLWTISHSPQQKVVSLQISPDSTFIVSGTDQGQIYIWSMGNGSLLKQYAGHRGSICAIQLFNDLTKVASLDTLDTVHIWPIQESQNPSIPTESPYIFKGARQFLFLTNHVEKALISKAAEKESEGRIWILNGGEAGPTLKSKPSHADSITTMCCSKDGNVLITASKDNSLKVWDITQGFITQVLIGHSDIVCCCATSDDGKSILSGSLDKTAIVWEVSSGNAKFTFTDHIKTVNVVAVTSDGTVGLSGGEDGWIYCWDMEKGRRLASFNAHRVVLDLQLTADAGRIVLKLDRCARMPILCLHNSPAGLNIAQNRRTSRTLSISSAGSSLSLASGPNAPVSVGPPVSSVVQPVEKEPHSHVGKSILVKGKSHHLERKSSKIFANLEKSKSGGTSVFENNTVSTRIASDKISTIRNAIKGKNGSAKPAEEQPPKSSSVCAIL